MFIKKAYKSLTGECVIKVLQSNNIKFDNNKLKHGIVKSILKGLKIHSNKKDIIQKIKRQVEKMWISDEFQVLYKGNF